MSASQVVIRMSDESPMASALVSEMIEVVSPVIGQAPSCPSWVEAVALASTSGVLSCRVGRGALVPLRISGRVLLRTSEAPSASAPFVVALVRFGTRKTFFMKFHLRRKTIIFILATHTNF